MKTVIVIHAALGPALEAGWSEPLLHALPYARRLELERRSPSARTASLAGLALLFAGAARAGRAASVRQLNFPDGGKPTLRDGPCFSVSHSLSRAVCAVGDVRELGIDVEDVDREVERLRLLRWTATEAALKAAGRGVRDLRQVRVDDDLQGARVSESNYRLHELALGSQCVAQLATPAVVRVDVTELGLDDEEVSAVVERSLRLGAQLE